MTSGPDNRRRSIAEELRRMNAETSARLSAVAPLGGAPVRTGRAKMLAAACGAFARSYVGSKNVFRGKEGLILSCIAALAFYLLAFFALSKVKLEHLPPHPLP